MSCQFKNRAELSVTACGKTHTFYSNEVEVNKVLIRIEKSSCKQCVFGGDLLDYTVKIYNDGCVDVHNVIFYDDLPEGMHYEQNTFIVDNYPVTPAQPFGNRITYTLNEIKAGHEVVITFSTKVE